MYNCGLGDDDFVVTASNALDLNLVPVFSFWGIPVSTEAKQSVQHLSPPEGFKARLEHYKSIIPTTNAEFKVIGNRLSATTGSIGRWNYLSDHYDSNMAAIITARVDGILCEYYAETDGCLHADGDIDLDGISNVSDVYPFDYSNNDLERKSFNADGYLDNDGDGYLDIDEIAAGSDPISAQSLPLDTDSNFISNVTDTDDDNDGISDADEVAAGTDPLDPGDCSICGPKSWWRFKLMQAAS